jgi:hypothetical protein
LSCVRHLQSIYVSHGRGGAYELRCGSCYAEAQAWETVGCLVVAIIVVTGTLMMMTLAHR